MQLSVVSNDPFYMMAGAERLLSRKHYNNTEKQCCNTWPGYCADSLYPYKSHQNNNIITTLVVSEKYIIQVAVFVEWWESSQSDTKDDDTTITKSHSIVRSYDHW